MEGAWRQGWRPQKSTPHCECYVVEAGSQYLSGGTNRLNPSPASLKGREGMRKLRSPTVDHPTLAFATALRSEKNDLQFGSRDRGRRSPLGTLPGH